MQVLPDPLQHFAFCFETVQTNRSKFLKRRRVVPCGGPRGGKLTNSYLDGRTEQQQQEGGGGPTGRGDAHLGGDGELSRLSGRSWDGESSSPGGDRIGESQLSLGWRRGGVKEQSAYAGGAVNGNTR